MMLLRLTVMICALALAGCSQTDDVRSEPPPEFRPPARLTAAEDLASHLGAYCSVIATPIQSDKGFLQARADDGTVWSCSIDRETSRWPDAVLGKKLVITGVAARLAPVVTAKSEPARATTTADPVEYLDSCVWYRVD